MLKIILPLISILSGGAAGIGAGVYFHPDPEPQEGNSVSIEEGKEEIDRITTKIPREPPENLGYVKLSNQFVIPVIEGEEIASMVVMSLALEVDEKEVDNIYRIEPKVRHTLLDLLFRHASIGAFGGKFTNAQNMHFLRSEMLAAVKKDIGQEITDVLILELNRQDY